MSDQMRGLTAQVTDSSEAAIVTKHDSQWKFGVRWFGSLAAAPLAMLIAGCSPDGSGSIKVGDPQSVRARADGGLTSKTPVSKKQAAALKAEEEAAKKNPKLR
jgi:hypothetical protein